MGQQQLLLVILVTIIVGIATVVAINTFSSAADSANVDAVRQDILSIASSAQQYYMKPAALGGGGNSFKGITFENIGGVPGDVGSNTSTLTNQNGTYTIQNIKSGSFEIKGEPAQAGGSMVYTVEPDTAYITTAYSSGT